MLTVFPTPRSVPHAVGARGYGRRYDEDFHDVPRYRTQRYRTGYDGPRGRAGVGGPYGEEQAPGSFGMDWKGYTERYTGRSNSDGAGTWRAGFRRGGPVEGFYPMPMDEMMMEACHLEDGCIDVMP